MAYGEFDKQALISTKAKIELNWLKENIKSFLAPIKVQPVYYTIQSIQMQVYKDGEEQMMK